MRIQGWKPCHPSVCLPWASVPLCSLHACVTRCSLFLNLSYSFPSPPPRSLSFFYICICLSRSLAHSLSPPPLFSFDVASLFHCRSGTDRSAPILFRIIRILDVIQVLIRYYFPNSFPNEHFRRCFLARSRPRLGRARRQLGIYLRDKRRPYASLV